MVHRFYLKRNAVRQKDQEGVEDLLDDTRMDIQGLPDPTIGKLELRDYGYIAEDMAPLHRYLFFLKSWLFP